MIKKCKGEIEDMIWVISRKCLTRAQCYAIENLMPRNENFRINICCAVPVTHSFIASSL